MLVLVQINAVFNDEQLVAGWQGMSLSEMVTVLSIKMAGFFFLFQKYIEEKTLP